MDTEGKRNRRTNLLGIRGLKVLMQHVMPGGVEKSNLWHTCLARVLLCHGWIVFVSSFYGRADESLICMLSMSNPRTVSTEE